MRKVMLLLLVLLAVLPARAEGDVDLSVFDGTWEQTSAAMLNTGSALVIEDAVITRENGESYTLQIINNRPCVVINPSLTTFLTLDANDQLYLYDEEGCFSIYSRKDAAPTELPVWEICHQQPNSYAGVWTATEMIWRGVYIDLTRLALPPIQMVVFDDHRVTTLLQPQNTNQTNELLSFMKAATVSHYLADDQLSLRCDFMHPRDFSITESMLILTRTSTYDTLPALLPMAGYWNLRHVGIGPMMLPVDLSDDASQVVIDPTGFAVFDESIAVIVAGSDGDLLLQTANDGSYGIELLDNKLCLKGSNDTSFHYTRDYPWLVAVHKGRWLLTDYEIDTPYVAAEIVSEIPIVLEITLDGATLTGDFGEVDLQITPDYESDELRLTSGDLTLIMTGSGDYRYLEDEADTLSISLELIE